MNAPETTERGLDRALLRGMAWTAAMRWTSQVVSWVATFYVARILLPADYGLIALGTVAIGYARMVEDFGLDSIFVQNRQIQSRELAQLAGMLLAFGLLCVAVYEAIAIPVAAFFKEPKVAWIIGCLALLFISDALQVIPRALLQRRLAFDRLAVLAFVQTLVTQAVLVAMASAGFGYRSLVFNSLAGALVTTVILLFWCPIRIAWPRNLAAIAQPMLQGWRVLAARLGYYAYTTMDQLFIGRALGKDALGNYSFAQTFSTTAMQEVGSVVSKVVPGVFSASQDRRDELRRYFLILTEFVALLTLPMSLGIALTADLIVKLILGPHWDAVVTPLRILCAYTAFFNAQLLTSHLMTWTGQFRAQMWCTMVTAVTLPVAFWYGTRYGLAGVAIAWAVVFPLTNVPALVLSFRTIGIGVMPWLRSLYPATIGCVFMAIAVLLVRSRLLASDHSLIVNCTLSIGTGALTYGVSILLLFRPRLIELWQFMKAIRN